MDVSFLDNTQIIEEGEVQAPAEVKDFIDNPPDEDLASDFLNSFKKRKATRASQQEQPKEQPKEPEPPTQSNSDIEGLRSVLRLYLNFWPDSFPGYSQTRISEMAYSELLETKLIFDTQLSSGSNAQSMVNIFYHLIALVEQGANKYGINLTGLSDCCQKTKEIDDDIKYLAIQLVSKNNISPQIRLALNLFKTTAMVYKFHQMEEAKLANKN